MTNPLGPGDFPSPDSCGELLRALDCCGPVSRGLAETLLADTGRREARCGDLQLHAVSCPWLTIKGFLSPSAQSPPRGPGPSVSAGGKTCWSTTVARPGMTSMYPSVMTWATSCPCSATGRVTSAGVWTKMAEKCRAPARSQAPPLPVSTRGLPHSAHHLEGLLEVTCQLWMKVGESGGHQVQ